MGYDPRRRFIAQRLGWVIRTVLVPGRCSVTVNYEDSTDGRKIVNAGRVIYTHSYKKDT